MRAARAVVTTLNARDAAKHAARPSFGSEDAYVYRTPLAMVPMRRPNALAM